MKKKSRCMNLNNLSKSIKFIQKDGNELDKLRLTIALGKKYTKEEAINILKPYQFPDGSWDYESPEENSNRIGSLGGTIHCLRWIREFDLEQSLLMEPTLNFLSNVQFSDGSFYETKEKLTHSPQKWLQEETLIDRFYFTAAVPMRLFSLGYSNHDSIKYAIEWLNQNHKKWDSLAGTWYGPWAVLCLFPFNEDLPKSLYEKCYNYALDCLPKVYPQALTWLLDALNGAKFPVIDSLIKKGIQRLKNLQNKQGLWNDSQYSTIETSITAIKLIRIYS